MAKEKDEWIRRRAHEIWESEGRPEGAESRHWQQASDEFDKTEEHEAAGDRIEQDDRDKAGLLQGAGKSGDVDPPPVNLRGGIRGRKGAAPIPETEITTGEKPARRQVKKTEGP